MNRPSVNIFYPTLAVLSIALCFQPAYGQTTNKPFLLKTEYLESGKKKIKQQDPAFVKAFESLKKLADKTLDNGPYSVTFKEKAPPGGSKHDYFSMGPYWWPDTTKPGGLPYIRRDGEVNPERNSIKDASYHSALCNDIFILGLAWYFTADERYASHATKLLNTWFLDPGTKMNPHLNYGQAIPGITNGRGIGLIDTRKAVYLIDGIQLLHNSKAMDNNTYTGIRDWYRGFLDWMLNSPIGKDEARQHNNHGTFYDVQAISIALFTGQPDVARNILEEKTKERIDKQLAEDGSQPHELARTLSANYSQMNLAGFVELALLAENVGLDLWNYRSKSGKSIKNALTWMLPYVEGKKTWTHKQIKPVNWSSFLKTASVAAPQYPDTDFGVLWKKHGTPSDMVSILTHSLF